MAISLANATRLALWLAKAHPAAFREIAWQMQTAGARARAGGLGAFGYAGRQVYVAYGRPRGGHYRPTGAFGDDAFTVDIPDTVSVPDTIDLSDPSLTDVSVDVNAIAPTTDVSAYTGFDSSAGSGSSVSDVNFTGANFDPSTDSSGFWSSLGNAFSSAGGVIASVAKNLTNPQVLSSAGNVAASVIKSNAQTQAIAAQQQAVLQAQIARVQAGTTPAPIRYVTSAAGQSVPMVYNASTGQYTPVTGATLSSLLPTGLPNWLPWALAGGLVLTVVLSSRS